MACPTIILQASVLRSWGLRILGSGAGSVDPPVIMAEMPRLMQRVADGGIRVPVRQVRLDDSITPGRNRTGMVSGSSWCRDPAPVAAYGCHVISRLDSPGLTLTTARWAPRRSSEGSANWTCRCPRSRRCSRRRTQRAGTGPTPNTCGGWNANWTTPARWSARCVNSCAEPGWWGRSATAICPPFTWRRSAGRRTAPVLAPRAGRRSMSCSRYSASRARYRHPGRQGPVRWPRPYPRDLSDGPDQGVAEEHCRTEICWPITPFGGTS